MTEPELSSLPRYDWRRSYDWNYDHAPAPVKFDQPAVRGDWTYCGLPVPTPLGIAAGPLLNSRWILYYASLGFDILTYKTVRSQERKSYPTPNLQPVAATRVTESGQVLPACADMSGSWAVSFGMPSKSPDVWRADVRAARRALPPEKILSVSVVATPGPEWTLDDVVADFAQCAAWAVESGADCIEANFSCPNVASLDGRLYHQPEAAGLVAARVRRAIGSTPLLVKIGHVTDETLAAGLLQALAPSANALVMVNCIPATVRDEQNQPLFNGEPRGIAGSAIADAVLEQVQLFARLIPIPHHAKSKNTNMRIVGGGGVARPEHVRAHLAAGCHAVQLATAPMLNPQLGIELRKAFLRFDVTC